MSRARPSAASVQCAFVLVFLSIVAFLIAPLSYGDRSVLVPPTHELDATLASLLVADGVDKLLSDPAAFYNTAILYPDRTQLRSTEPFLGYALIALPLRSVFRLGDVDVFEMVRWAMLFASLTYAYLLFRAAGLDVAMSTAGATLCLCQPNLLNGIERLQILSIPLLFPVLYHGLMVWAARRSHPGHSIGLFFWLAMYPLCGMINATVGVVAGLLLLPLLLKMCVDLWREKRLPAVAVPLFAAAAVDAIVLAPWLLDRADMAVYTTPAFLAIKTWRPTFVPLRIRQVPAFVDGRVGVSLTVALAMLCVVIAVLRVARQTGGAGRRSVAGGVADSVIWVVPVLTLAMAGLAAYGINRDGARWLGALFDVGCAAALLMFWRNQVRLSGSKDQDDIARHLVLVSAGLGVFLSLVSFGPAAGTNRFHPVASGITTVLLDVVPPMKSIREFDRFWIFGMLFLSVYAVVTIGRALRGYARLIRGIAVAFLLVAASASLYGRRLVASPAIEAPKDFVAFAAKSPGKGAIYVHPYMRWNSRSGVLMIAIARELRRPIVNGYLGINLPWFSYAANVLHRFPDPEALWLLRKWKVETVVSLGSDAKGDGLEQVERVGQQPDMAIWEVPSASDLSHPSGEMPSAPGAQERIDTAWTRRDRGATITFGLTAPAGLSVRRLEIHFRQTAVALVPVAVDVYGIERAARVRLNEGRSGEWLESLAADALVRRESPVAIVRLVRPATGELELECRNSTDPPIERIVLIGERD
jgi:hypothetical protein